MRLLALAGLGLGFTSAALAEDLAAVEKKITADWHKHKSMTAKITAETHMEMGTMTMDMKGAGTLEVMRTGDKILVRMETNNTITQVIGGEETKLEQPSTIIVDGEFTYSVDEAMGQKRAIKQKIDPAITGEPKAMFERFRKDNELKLLPEESIDGKKVFVIAVTPKQPPAMPGVPAKTHIYFDQQNGCLVKMVEFDADDKVMTTMTYTDIKLDVKLDPERFKFVAPEGVKVMDLTGG
ncbi:MAG: outer membrane lipoprotein carrier protein LolA [Phycisphaerae bacterium]|nr:outer membrane lipoprotein carrier protein LolA [Phycisphaerae bacterium]